MSKLNLDSVIKDLQRKKYIEAMKETRYGWERSKSENYSHVGCPDDLDFVSEKDLPHPTDCVCECEYCWNYVLYNKWK